MQFEREWLTSQEVLILYKVLLESRALCKIELNTVINKLKNQVTPNGGYQIENVIQNEQALLCCNKS